MNFHSDEEKEPFALTSLHLKLIGWICTLAGAFAVVFFPTDSFESGKMLLLVLSYIAMPIFAFLLVEGVEHTGSLGKYILRTLIAALIAEPFYNFARFGQWLNASGENAQNVLFTLVICQVLLYFLRFVGQEGAWRIILSWVLVLAGAVWATLFATQYGAYLVLITGIFYILREHILTRNIITISISLLWYYTPELGLIPIHFYQGERGSYNKYIFYALYPALWIVLALLKWTVLP